MKNLPEIEALLEAVVRRELQPLLKDVRTIRTDIEDIVKKQAEIIERQENLKNMEMRLTRIK